jgi:TetR/AcrR family transcriptional regulator, mexJK operon transcriptional repressor
MSSLRSKKQSDILDAATKLFLDRGYDAVALDDILERVGGSKTTLYSYYGCKEGLFEATVERLCQEKFGAQASFDVAGLDPREGLERIGLDILRRFSESATQALLRVMIAEAQRFPDLARVLLAGQESALRSLRSSIEKWQRERLLRKGNSELLAAQFFGLLLGDLQIKSLLGLPEPLTDKQARTRVRRGVELFLDGARAR